MRIELEEASAIKAAQVANGVLVGMTETPLDLLEVHGDRKFPEGDLARLVASTRAGTKALTCSWDD